MKKTRDSNKWNDYISIKHSKSYELNAQPKFLWNAHSFDYWTWNLRHYMQNKKHTLTIRVQFQKIGLDYQRSKSINLCAAEGIIP